MKGKGKGGKDIMQKAGSKGWWKEGQYSKGYGKGWGKDNQGKGAKAAWSVDMPWMPVQP